jgi:hypothetical protein
MAPANPLPWWLGPASRLNLLVLRLGLRIGTQHILSVPGRNTGRMRSTPRVASHTRRRPVRRLWRGLLRARRRERVSLTELPPDERGPILRAFWHQAPAGRSFIARLFGLAPDASADDFEAAAPRSRSSG